MAAVTSAAGLFGQTSTALFPIALGLAGLGASFHFANLALAAAIPENISRVILLLAFGVLFADISLYVFKFVRVRGEVIEEFSMATSANLLAPGFMAATVIGGLSASEIEFGVLLWLAGAMGHLMLLVAFVGQWLRREYKPEALNPTWFLPAAGIMTVPMSWPGYGPVELPLFTLAIGGVLWAMLLPLVFRRLVLEPAVEPELRPTLFIIAAPFGLMAGALMTLFPQIPRTIPLVFVFAGTFFILVLISQTRFLNKAGASLAWWAPTFPVATIASGYLRLSDGVPSVILTLGTALLGLACVTTTLAIIATFHTTWNYFRGEGP